MIIRLAKNSGFCFGVKRAINIAKEEGAKGENKIYTIGPIIHNPQVVTELEDMNIFSTDDLDAIENHPAIIRSHGLAKDKIEYLQSKGANLIDATCPNVSELQKHGQRLSEKGYTVVILGDKKHPEVRAVCSYIKGECVVVASAEELSDKKYRKVAVLSQTTQTYKKFEDLVRKLLNKCYEIHVVNTICGSTSVRQNSTKALAQQSDIMIVVGGRMSSNTKMLAKISTDYCDTYHIETADDIKPAWFNEKESVGITAGASTPDYLILNVYNIINNINGIMETAERLSDIPVFKEELNEL